MSKLYFSEKGHVVPSLCEELTSFRHVRKTLYLPPTAAPGILYLLARPHAEAERPLRLAVNGEEIESIRPGPTGGYQWYQTTVEANVLKPGPNTFELWTDAGAMDAWSLGLEAGHELPHSAISDDAGVSWRSEKMGYLNVLRGEYIVRLRLQELADPEPPPVVREDPAHPRLERLRQVLPAAALGSSSTLERVRALTTWLSSSWEHTSAARATQYAPWDVETLLVWGGAQLGHNGQRPIAMCVHYGAALASCCQAIGIPARCAVFTQGLNTPNGHFTAEVYFDDFDKWVLVDPNLDAILWRDGVPLSVAEVQRAGNDLSALVEWGPGIEAQRRNPLIEDWISDVFLTGLCFRHRSVWQRADLLSHPEYSPPGHGSTSYCETSLVWEKEDLDEGFGMFPYFADSAYFDAAPA